jgi:hypothetical protein
LKRVLIGLLKIAISLAILVYLVRQAHRNEVFHDLAERPKHWGFLAAAALAESAAVTLTFVRWWLLVRCLGLPLRLREGLRMGFLSYLFNLAPMGIVGGDLLKAVMLARHQRGQRAKALATVVVDRAIGLYMLFLVASVAILATGLWRSGADSIRLGCLAVVGLTLLGAAILPLPVLPDLSRGGFTAWVGRWPLVGPKLRHLIEVVRLYEHHKPALVACSLMSVVVHGLFALAVYLIAAGLYERVHPLSTHFIVVPLSSATQVLPINIGPFEAGLDALYAMLPLPGGGRMAGGQGLVVALGYRIITIIIAAVGLGYYLASRREIAEVLHEAQSEEEGEARSTESAVPLPQSACPAPSRP